MRRRPRRGGSCARAATRSRARRGNSSGGIDAWHPVDPATGKALSDWIRAPFSGSLSPSGDRGVFTTEGVQFAFRLTGSDEMEMEMASFKVLGGLAPTAFYAVLKRGSLGAEARTKWVDLSGSWRGRCPVAQPGRLRPSGVRLDLVRQDGELIWMDNVWSPTGPVTGATDPKQVLRERMMGSFNPQGNGGVLAKKDVRVRFRLLAPDLLEAEFVRVGGKHDPATAFFVLLRRGGEETLPPVAHGVDLTGTWSGTYRYAFPDRIVEATSSVVFTGQEGGALWAEDVWAEPAAPGALPIVHRDPMAGSLSPDGSRGALAKGGAYLTFRVIGPDRLEFALSGVAEKPTAFFGILTRQRAGEPSRAPTPYQNPEAVTSYQCDCRS